MPAWGSLFQDYCRDPGSGLDLDWSVDSWNGPVVRDAPYRPYAFGGSGEVVTELGTFEALPGNHYWVSLRIRDAAPELVNAHPRITVRSSGLLGEVGNPIADGSLLNGPRKHSRNYFLRHSRAPQELGRANNSVSNAKIRVGPRLSAALNPCLRELLPHPRHELLRRGHRG